MSQLQMISPLMSAEFVLAARCCVWPHTVINLAAIRTAADASINWLQFLRVVRRHRIAGLVYRGLQAAGVPLPSATAAALNEAAMVITRHSLRLAAEAYRMQGLLAQRGINVLTIKGATVAQQVYGDLAVRHSKDIDFVVMPDEVDAALAVIAEAGYTRIHPSATLSDPKFWQHYVRVRKECEFIDATRRMQLELHWRLTDNPLLFPVPPRSSWQPIALTSTMTLTGLSRDELFLYLCVHGTGHGWMRLKWLADIAAILARDDSDGAARLYAFAQARGLARCVAPALLLCHSLLNAPLPEDLVARLSDDRINRWLVTVAERLLTSGDASAEILDQPFGTTMVSASHLLLRREWRYRLAELRNMLTFDEDFLLLPLPPPLFFLYPALRLPLWAWRRARYQGRSRS